MTKDEIIHKLYDIGALKFGSFTLKSGIVSPFYLDMRLTVSYPHILKAIGDLLWQQVEHVSFDLLCGVPYTALPIATQMSLAHNMPMVIKRREAKDHGTRKMVEGKVIPGEKCLVVEDLITSGASIFETIHPIEEAGLKVQDVVVFLDRQQGGRETVEAKGKNLHSVTTITEMLESLSQHQKVEDERVEHTLAFVKKYQFAPKKEKAHV